MATTTSIDLDIINKALDNYWADQSQQVTTTSYTTNAITPSYINVSADWQKAVQKYATWGFAGGGLVGAIQPAAPKAKKVATEVSLTPAQLLVKIDNLLKVMECN